MKVATPLEALTVFVPDNVPPPGFVPIASVIDAVLDAVLPLASCTVTTTENDAPPVVLTGCVVNASFEAAPAAMLNVLLVAPVRPDEDAVSV